MSDGHRGNQVAIHSGLRETVLEIYLFTIHVEALIHAAEAVEGSTGHNHASTHNPVSLRIRSTGACLNVMADTAVPPVSRLKTSQRSEPFPSHMRCGGELACDPLLLAIVANNLGASENLAVTLYCSKHARDEGVIQF